MKIARLGAGMIMGIAYGVAMLSSSALADECHCHLISIGAAQGSPTQSGCSVSFQWIVKGGPGQGCLPQNCDYSWSNPGSGTSGSGTGSNGLSVGNVSVFYTVQPPGPGAGNYFQGFVDISISGKVGDNIVSTATATNCLGSVSKTQNHTITDPPCEWYGQ